MFKFDEATALEGPLMVLETENAIDHPQHGNVILGPGTYGIEYQRAYATELRRQQD
jgi:hypothetical protein